MLDLLDFRGNSSRKKLGSSTMVGVMLIGFHGYRHTDFTPISLDILKLYRRVAENVALFSR